MHGVFFGVLFLIFTAAPALAGACDQASDLAQATAQARLAVAQDDPEAQREALTCLLAATEALDRKLDDLIAGRIPFGGPIIADGFWHSERGMQMLRARSGVAGEARDDAQ